MPLSQQYGIILWVHLAVSTMFGMTHSTCKWWEQMADIQLNASPVPRPLWCLGCAAEGTRSCPQVTLMFNLVLGMLAHSSSCMPLFCPAQVQLVGACSGYPAVLGADWLPLRPLSPGTAFSPAVQPPTNACSAPRQKQQSTASSTFDNQGLPTHEPDNSPRCSMWRGGHCFGCPAPHGTADDLAGVPLYISLCMTLPWGSMCLG